MPDAGKRSLPSRPELPHFEDVLTKWQNIALGWEIGEIMQFSRPLTAAAGMQLENLRVRPGDPAIFLGVSDTNVVTLLVAGRPGLYAVSVVPLLQRL